MEPMVTTECKTVSLFVVAIEMSQSQGTFSEQYDRK